MTSGTPKVDHETILTTPASYLATLVGFIYAVDWEKAIYIALAIGTFVVNWYYQHQRYKQDSPHDKPNKQSK